MEQGGEFMIEEVGLLFKPGLDGISVELEDLLGGAPPGMRLRGKVFPALGQGAPARQRLGRDAKDSGDVFQGAFAAVVSVEGGTAHLERNRVGHAKLPQVYWSIEVTRGHLHTFDHVQQPVNCHSCRCKSDCERRLEKRF